jgi:CRISPR/Cas system-associated exonuclease Cas4 (RecB family)
MNDERKNLPSASSMERYMLCPGSWAAEQGQPEQPSSDADSGNRIHAALAGETVNPPLTEDEERTAEACKVQAEALIQNTVGDGCRIVREEREWSMDERWSGKADVVALNRPGTRATVIDYKTGRGEVTDSTGNMQLRALAVLVSDSYWADEVTVAIVQPLAGPVSTCTYTSTDLDRARSEITGIIDAIHKADAPRIPSAKACKYCRAKGVCQEAQKLATEAPLMVSRNARELSITPERMAEFLEQIPAIEAVVEAVQAKAKRMLEADPASVPGWTLKPGAGRESITDPAQVFGRFIALGGTQEQFMPAVTVKKTGLREAVKAVTSEKGKALDARMDAILAGLTEEKQAAPSLVRVKGGQ